MARCGIEMFLIQLMGRWGSSAVQRYVQEAPLSHRSGVTAKIGSALSLSSVTQLAADTCQGGMEASQAIRVAVGDAANGKVVAAFDGVYELPAVDGTYAVGDKVEASAAQGSIQALSAGELFGKVIEAVVVSGGDNKVKVKLAG